MSKKNDYLVLEGLINHINLNELTRKNRNNQ